MAYDKIVDSAKLDAAMMVTADAIRAKTGKVDKIIWDSDVGFAAEIDGISQEEDLSELLDAQESKLNSLCEILESKASGNFVDTCTVQIKSTWYIRTNKVVYTSINKSGKVISKEISQSTIEITLEDVVCNSVVYVETGYIVSSNKSIRSGIEFLMTGSSLNQFAMQVTADAGATATVDFRNEEPNLPV